MSSVLIADDNAADIELLCLAFSENDVHPAFHIAHDGQEALNLLAGVNPDLILLDVNMPKLGGLQVLEAVRSRGDMNSVPVIIMSSSKAERDINRALSLGALRYWQKGSLFTDILAFVHSLPDLIPSLKISHSLQTPRPPFPDKF